MQKLWLIFFMLALPISGYAQQKDTFKVAILMFDQVQIIDFAAPYEVFGQAKFDVYTVSKDGKAITTAMGLHVSPEYSFANLPKVDAVLVPGGDVDKVMHDEEVLRWLETRAKSLEYVLSVCTGSHILAEAHLLDGLQATTFHRQIDYLRENYPAINVVNDRRYSDNGKVITSAGLSSGMDAALHLVSNVQGLEAAKTIAHHIEYDWQQDEGYIRAQMADQYYPQLDYRWPENIEFSKLASYGDKQNWRLKYAVKTQASAEQLRDVVQQAMTKLSQWQGLPSSIENQLLWQHDIAGQNWQLKLSTEEDKQREQIILQLDIYRTP